MVFIPQAKEIEHGDSRRTKDQNKAADEAAPF